MNYQFSSLATNEESNNMAARKTFKMDPRALKFGEDTWDPTHRLETSWLFTPWTLFSIRALISLYAFTVLFFIIGWEASGTHFDFTIHDVHKSFSFFTVLTYWGIAFYFLVSSIHTFTYALHGTPLLTQFPRPLQALHSLFFTTITTYPFLVTIVYWGVLFSGHFSDTFSTWSNTSQHALNTAFAIFEIVFTRTNPQPWIHLLFLLILLALYLGVAYITYATKHYYVYSFLNPNPKNEVVGADGTQENIGGVGRGGVAAYVAGIAVGIIVIFCLSRGLIALRKWVTEKKLGKEGRFYAGRKMDSRDGEVELEGGRVWKR